jgi:Zn-dependent protease with chaperone function
MAFISKTKGLYFDGYTSVPTEVEVEMNESLNEIKFIVPEGNYFVWNTLETATENFSDCMEIRQSAKTDDFLKISDKDFRQSFISYLKKNGKISLYNRLLDSSLKVHLLITVFIIALIFGGYKFIIPVIAEKAVILIPENFDKYLGNNYINHYLTSVSVDEEKTVSLNEFAARLDLNNEDLNFTVIKSDIVNAFALPDGNIVVYTGLLDKMEEYEELAGLIGHETAHINHRHSMKELCRNLGGYLFISIILTDTNGIMNIIAENAHNLQGLSYSRKFEREADEEGTNLMMKNNIDPYGMLKLFSRLEKEHDKSLIPEFMSTHPATKERIKNVDEYIVNNFYKTEFNADLDSLFRQIKKSP